MLNRYPWQIEALKDERPKLIMAVSPRAGKSLYAIDWIAKHSFKRILILSPLVVLPQWETFIEEHLQPRHSVTVYPIYRKLPKAIGALLEACKGQETPFILLCNYDKLKEIHGKSLTGMLKQIDELKLDAIIGDECFVAGTLVGTVPIECIRLGMLVDSFDQMSGTMIQSVVVAVRKKIAKTLCTITLGESRLVCTHEHPIFTQRGFVSAVALTPRDFAAMPYMPKNAYLGLPQVKRVRISSREFAMFSRMSGIIQKNISFSDIQGSLGGYANQQPYEKFKNEGTSKRNLERHETQALETRGQWEHNTYGRTLKSGLRTAILSLRSKNPNEKGFGVPNKLQARPSVPRNFIGDRSRWIFAHGFNKTGTRPEERSIFKFVRVDSLTIHEQTSDGSFGGMCRDGYVYNLEVKESHTYTANGFVVHNCHMIKAPATQRGKAVRYLCQSIPNVRLLTGTMAPNGVEDLWGQFACIDPETWKPNYTQFKRVHLITNEYDYGKVIGVQKPKLLEKMVKAGSLTYNRDDIFGPDTWIETVREIDLDRKSRDMYDAIVKTWVLEQEEFGVDLEVTHALARMMKLRQLTSGFLSTDEGIIEVNTHKLDLVMEDLGDIIRANEKAVIFHQFKHEGEIYGTRTLGVPVYRIDGSTPSEERAHRVSEFTNLKGPAVFVINTHAGGIGISLASASHALFVSQSYSYAVETQARDRIYSPGKVRTVTYYRVNRSIDQYISSVLLSKTNFNNLLKQSKIRDIAYGTVTYHFEGNIR